MCLIRYRRLISLARERSQPRHSPAAPEAERPRYNSTNNTPDGIIAGLVFPVGAHGKLAETGGNDGSVNDSGEWAFTCNRLLRGQ